MKKHVKNFYTTEDGVNFTVAYAEELYVTEDGSIYTKEEDALAHENTLKSKRFESLEAMIAFFKETDIWKDWEKNLKVYKYDVITFKSNVEILAENLSKAFPENYINNLNRATNLNYSLWKHFEPEAIVAYFESETNLKLSEEKILKIFDEVRSNHKNLEESLEEFDSYIDAIEIAFGMDE